VRMGLCAGTSQERDGDYFGPALTRVARLPRPETEKGWQL